MGCLILLIIESLLVFIVLFSFYPAEQDEDGFGMLYFAMIFFGYVAYTPYFLVPYIWFSISCNNNDKLINTSLFLGIAYPIILWMLFLIIPPFYEIIGLSRVASDLSDYDLDDLSFYLGLIPFVLGAGVVLSYYLLKYKRKGSV